MSTMSFASPLQYAWDLVGMETVFIVCLLSICRMPFSSTRTKTKAAINDSAMGEKSGAGTDTDEVRVNTFLADGDLEGAVTFAESTPLPAKLLVRILKTALNNVDLTLRVMQEMQRQGLSVPVNATAQFVQRSFRSRTVSASLETLAALKLTPEGLAGLVETLARNGTLDAVEQVLAFADKLCIGVAYTGLDAVSKALAKMNDRRAFTYFDRLAALGLQEGSCVSLLTFCAEGHNVPLAEHILAAARKSGCATVVVYSAFMRVYANARLFKKTCELYTALEKDGVEPDTIMYGCVIKAAVECGRLDLSRTLLQKSGIMDIQNYMSLFRACGRERNAKKVLNLLTELEKSEVGVDTTAYNCVLDVCIKCGDKRAVADLFTKMKVTGYVDTISYNTLLKGMGKGATGLTDPKMILAEMKQFNLQPDDKTYNSLVNYSIGTGDLTAAWGLIDNMKGDGVPIDNFTCSIMMKSLRQSTRPVDMDRTLSLIECASVTPDDVLVNTLLDSCIRMKDVGRVTSALKAFRSSGVLPSEHAYASVFKAYGHANAFDEVSITWKDMLSRKVVPSDATVLTLVEVFCKKSVQDALLALQELRHAVPTFKVGASTCMALVKACSKKNVEAAVQVYDAVREMGSLSLPAYNALIDVCARYGESEKAAVIFRDMCTAGVAPDLSTYSLMIKAYVIHGDLEQAIQLFQLMRKRDVQPDAGLFNVLLDGCVRKDMPMLVDHVIADMEKSGVQPTHSTLAILVKMAGKKHDVETAFSYVDMYKVKHNLMPNVQVYAALVAACVSAGDMDKASLTFASLKSPDAKVYTTLINGYLKVSDIQESMRVLENALRQRVHFEQELVDNVLFMASRRNVSVAGLTKQLTAAGYKMETQAKADSTAKSAAPRRKQEWRAA